MYFLLYFVSDVYNSCQACIPHLFFPIYLYAVNCIFLPLQQTNENCIKRLSPSWNFLFDRYVFEMRRMFVCNIGWIWTNECTLYYYMCSTWNKSGCTNFTSVNFIVLNFFLFLVYFCGNMNKTVSIKSACPFFRWLIRLKV